MTHSPTANSSRDPPCHHCPCHLLTLTSTLHPLAATALCDGSRCRPCLPPCHQSTLTSHPTAATALRDCFCPCLPPCRRSTLRVDINVASYCYHQHAQSSLSLLSPSLSLSLSPPLSLPPPPVNDTCQRRILPPPPPCAIVVVVIVPATCQR
jgi:hypothetical protein